MDLEGFGRFGGIGGIIWGPRAPVKETETRATPSEALWVTSNRWLDDVSARNREFISKAPAPFLKSLIFLT